MKPSFLFFSILLSLSISLTTYAQKSDTVVAVITYAFRHIRDTTNVNNVYTENMDLFLAKNASVYKSSDKAKIDSINMVAIKAGGVTQISPIKAYNMAELYMYPAEHKFLYVEQFFKTNYLMEDEWPNIKWNITNEKKKIAQLNCQKALGSWRGRTYEAWFCSDLPYNVGPWKLSGLPGLIVEAADLKKQVVFKFAGYRTVNDKTSTIKLPAKNEAQFTTLQKFKKFKDATMQNPGPLLKSTYNVKIISSSPSPKGNLFNNPIELTNP